MATAVAPPPAAVADQSAADLLQKLTLDSHPSKEDATDASNKPSAAGGVNYRSAGSANGGIVPAAPYDRSLTPQSPEFMDLNMFYVHNGYPYYYGGYDGLGSEWDSRYANRNGVDMSPGSYGELYHHGYGYGPYGAYPSAGSVPTVATVGPDGQLYGSQPYQYSTSFYQSPTPSNASPAAPTSQGDLPASTPSNQQHVPSEANKARSNSVTSGINNGKSGPAIMNQNQHNLSSNVPYGKAPLQGMHSSNGYQNAGYRLGGARSPVPWFDSFNGQQRQTATSVPSSISYGANGSGKNYSQRIFNNIMDMHGQRPASGFGPSSPAYMNRMYHDNRFYGQYGNSGKPGFGFGSNVYNSRTEGRWGLTMENKHKPRGHFNSLYGFGNENQDGFSELNRGPRSGNVKNQKPLGPNVTLVLKGQSLPSILKQDSAAIPDREQFNREDFPVSYNDGKFFIIKSYSEDDVHKSVKYNVWASTPNGNKKLDAAFQDAQDNTDGCPVFLFFSVNTSGQFVGVAEMIGPVDFNRSVDYWQQDKWNGCFPVKWHIVKDVPNSILKHITLENNDNKPVTNSRDTQEIKFDQGLLMLKIFKDHVSKTSILDDFGFYENRQKLMQEKRTKQKQVQSQVWDEKIDVLSAEKTIDGMKEKHKLPKLDDITGGNIGERKLIVDNGIHVAADLLSFSKSASEKWPAPNGIVNDC